MAKTQSDLLRECNEKLKPYYALLQAAKEKRATEERAIQSFGPDALDKLQGEAEKMQREISAGRGNFTQMRQLQLHVEQAKKDRAAREAAWQRWDKVNEEVEDIETTMEKIRDQHRLVK